MIGCFKFVDDCLSGLLGLFVRFVCLDCFSILFVYLIVWISDTHCQGYTELQSLIKCLDHRDIALVTVCSQARLC